MARIRKFAAYRRVERPYTRFSKYRNKCFVRAMPHMILSKFVMGSKTKAFPFRVELTSKSPVQIRHNAIESARMTANRHLEKILGKQGFFFRIRVYPFHILRENPLASGAGADRMSTGMKRSFGKPISRAAQIKKGQAILEVDVNKSDLPVARAALDRAKHKLPCSCSILTSEIKR